MPNKSLQRSLRPVRPPQYCYGGWIRRVAELLSLAHSPMVTRFRSRRVIATVAALVLFVASGYAFLVVRSTTTPPDPTLPQAYAKAVEALGGQTNTFYCLSASALAISDSSGPTEWHLVFYATNGHLREVVVPTSGKVIVR